MRTVIVYVAHGCHLCEAALEVVEQVRTETDFDLSVVDIADDASLEAQYREHIPVIEIDGVRAFRYYVTPDGLRGALA